MADEVAVPVAATTETPAVAIGNLNGTAATPTGDATANNGGSDRTFTQAELEKIIGDRLGQERSKAEKAAEKAKADLEAKELAAQGKYKEIADGLQAKLDAAEANARSASIKLLQRDAATETHLPTALADRLKGETLEEMIADAKSIMAALPKPAAPNINASNGGGGAPVPGQMTDAEKLELANRLGVNPKFM